MLISGEVFVLRIQGDNNSKITFTIKSITVLQINDLKQ